MRMRVLGIAITISLLWCLSIANQAIGEKTNELREVVVRDYTRYIRVVLCLEKATSYKVIPNLRAKTLTIEIPRSVLKLRNPVPEASGGIIQGITVGTRSSGSIRAEIKLRSSRVEFADFSYRNPPSIVINIREGKGSGTEEPSSKRQIQVPKKESHPLTNRVKPTSREKVKRGTAKEEAVAEQEEQGQLKPANSQKAAVEEQKQPEVETQPVVDSEHEGGDIFLAGSKLFHENKYFQAVEKFVSLREKFPQGKYAESAAFLIGDCYFEAARKDPSAKYTSAITAYKSALRLYPDSKKVAPAIFRIGESYWGMNIGYEAEVSFRILLNKYSDSEYAPEARFRLAEIMLKNNRIQEAITEFNRFLTGYPNDKLAEAAAFGIADAYCKIRDFKSAQEYYSRALERWPDYPRNHSETLFNIGETYFQNREYVKAREVFFRFINLFPQGDLRSKAMNRLGDSFRVEGKAEDALKFYSEVVSQYPEDRESWISKIVMADIGMKKPRLPIQIYIFDYDSYMEPLKAYKEVSKRFRGSELGDIALLREGLSYFSSGKYQEAISTFKSLLDKPPSSPLYQNAYRFTRDACVKTIDEDYGKKQFLSVVNSYVEHFDPFLKEGADGNTLFKVAESYQKLGLYSKAKTMWEEALKADNNGPLADQMTLKIGEASLLEGDYEEAERAFRKFTDRFPKSPYLIDVLHHQGDSLYKKGDLRQAVEAYLSALNKERGHPREAQTYYFLANSLEKLGYHSKAISAYRNAILSFKIDMGEKNSVPDFVLESYVRIGDSLYDARRYLEALNAYSDAKSLVTKDERAMWVSFRIANCYRELVKKKEAIQTLKELANNSTDEFWRRVADYTIYDLDWRGRHENYL